MFFFIQLRDHGECIATVPAARVLFFRSLPCLCLPFSGHAIFYPCFSIRSVHFPCVPVPSLSSSPSPSAPQRQLSSTSGRLALLHIFLLHKLYTSTSMKYRHRSCEIGNFVESSHLCKLRVAGRSLVLLQGVYVLIKASVVPRAFHGSGHFSVYQSDQVRVIRPDP